MGINEWFAKIGAMTSKKKIGNNQGGGGIT